MKRLTRVQLAKEYVDSNQCEVMDTTMAHEASFLAGWAARGKADIEQLHDIMDASDRITLFRRMKALDE